jgi:serine/threonine protein kinase
VSGAGHGGEDDASEHPTEYPGAGAPRLATATHAPVAQAGFTDPTADAFAATRRVSIEALRALVQARQGHGPEVKASLPPVSPQFLERLQRIRRQGMDAAGVAFGRYTVFGTIGVGGMAQIRLAAEPLPGGGVRLAVIKSLHPEHAGSEAHRALLVEEGRVCALLGHPNVVSLYDAGEVDGIPYLAFELVDGLTLRDLARLLDPARLPLSCIVALGAQAAAGLAHAHTATGADGAPLAVVHRDVTPHNILLTRHGQVKLVDFGIARFSGREVETVHGQLRGKLGYMAPEQCRVGPIDGRADVFALGLTLAELVSGRRVLPPTLMILRESASLIRAACADAVAPVPEALEALLVEMTAVDPAQRPWPTSQVVERLRELQDDLPGPGLEAYARDVFQRVLPLDLPALTDGPTRRAVLGAAQVAIQEDEAEDNYASTVRRLRPIPGSGSPPPVLEPTPPTPPPAVPPEAELRGPSVPALVDPATQPPQGQWAFAPDEDGDDDHTRPLPPRAPRPPTEPPTLAPASAPQEPPTMLPWVVLAVAAVAALAWWLGM